MAGWQFQECGRPFEKSRQNDGRLHDEWRLTSPNLFRNRCRAGRRLGRHFSHRRPQPAPKAFNPVAHRHLAVSCFAVQHVDVRGAAKQTNVRGCFPFAPCLRRHPRGKRHRSGPINRGGSSRSSRDDGGGCRPDVNSGGRPDYRTGCTRPDSGRRGASSGGRPGDSRGRDTVTRTNNRRYASSGGRSGDRGRRRIDAIRIGRLEALRICRLEALRICRRRRLDLRSSGRQMSMLTR